MKPYYGARLQAWLLAAGGGVARMARLRQHAAKLGQRRWNICYSRSNNARQSSDLGETNNV
jgi:hypothetical protein